MTDEKKTLLHIAYLMHRGNKGWEKVFFVIDQREVSIVYKQNKLRSNLQVIKLQLLFTV